MKDHRLKSLTRMLRRVEYFEQANDNTLLEILFSLKPTLLYKDHVILREQKQVKEVFFVETGTVSVST